MSGTILAVHRNPRHGFSKQSQPVVRLLAGRGVEGDAHCGETVQHVYLKRRNPSMPNRMQVHLLETEVLTALAVAGYDLQPGQLGENITTEGIALLHLPLGTRLSLGATAVVELTGLRTPCKQLETFRGGLLRQMTTNDEDGRTSARAGVMAIVVTSGDVCPGDNIVVELPPLPHRRMEMI